MASFHEASVGPQDNVAVYREALLADSEETVEFLMSIRPSSWALCAARTASVPERVEDFERDEYDQVSMLLHLFGSREDQRVHRWDRVIILKRGGKDRIDALLGFFRTWLPRLVAERRVFVASLPDDVELAPSVVLMAVGGAEPITEAETEP